MAASARDALAQRTIDPDVRRLFVALFFGDETRFDEAGIVFVRNRFDAVYAAHVLGSAPPRKQGRDITIYCNMDRVQRNNNGRWVDSHSLNDLGGGHESQINDCKTGGLQATLAFTWNPIFVSAAARAVEDEFLPSQVTICPWFLHWATRQRYSTWWHYSLATRLVSALKPLITKWPFAAIDAVTPLDKVLLHEYMHTNLLARPTKDVILHDNLPGSLLYGGRAYGWKRSIKLSKKNAADRLDLFNDDSAMQNADSYALFASGIRMLNDSPPKFITDDGGVSLTRITRRSFPDNSYNTSKSAEFEHFIALIREDRAAASAYAMTAA